MEDTLALDFNRRRLTTPDEGGSYRTDAVVDHFLSAVDGPMAETLPIRDDTPSEPTYAWIGKKTAVVLVNYQNDFLSNTQSGCGRTFQHDSTAHTRHNIQV
jgi:hypothetical protein